MAQTCTRCSRLNPVEAAFCYFDGVALPGHAHGSGPIAVGASAFPARSCSPPARRAAASTSWPWPASRTGPRPGRCSRRVTWKASWAASGRADLALAAREAARFPDPDRGLDQFLSKLPTPGPRSAAASGRAAGGQPGASAGRPGTPVRAAPAKPGHAPALRLDDLRRRLALAGARRTARRPEKLFDFTSELVVPVHVRGQQLRAGPKPLEGRLVIESNGGNVTVLVTAEVPAKPFTEGVLAGAKSPRQVAEKAKAAPKEAAVLPREWGGRALVQGEWLDLPDPGAAGVRPGGGAAVLRGARPDAAAQGGDQRAGRHAPGQPRRPRAAHAGGQGPGEAAGLGAGDQRPAVAGGRPHHPGRPCGARPARRCRRCPTGRAKRSAPMWRWYANGNQRFVVLVTLVVGTTRVGLPQAALPTGILADPVSSGVRAAEAAIVTMPAAQPPPASPRQPGLGVYRGATRPDWPAPTAAAWLGLLPAALLGLILLAFAIRDIFFAKARAGGLEDTGPAYRCSSFHDGTTMTNSTSSCPSRPCASA